MSEYAKMNNISQNDNQNTSLRKWSQENFKESIYNEFFELIDAINNFDIVNIILEYNDLLHSIIKYFIISFLPQNVYCSDYIWLPVFFIVFPVGIKLSVRYKNYGCIRNHNNKNNCNHNCNYKFK
jgi:hypothetical protein